MGFFNWFKKTPVPAIPVTLDFNHIDAENLFKEAMAEAEAEKDKEEKELLRDKNLSLYLKNCFKVIAKEHVKADTFCISHMDVGIKEEYLQAFRKIFEAIADSIGLKTHRNGQYIYIHSKDVKSFLKKIEHQSIDVDETLRDMLSSEPYR